ncbi:unnamed protein product [Meloidogyne enterolobii]|uniref:Uncharacterized protein n=1 Tax=Meloidogyne enterolobii TaxID=390850 RepID=A0ACB0Y9A3_MELEN
MNQRNYVRIREILLQLAPLEYTRNQLAALEQSTDNVENLIAPLNAELENLRNTTVRFIDRDITLSYNRDRTLATVTGSFNRGASDLYCYSMFFFEITITHVPEFGGNR